MPGFAMSPPQRNWLSLVPSYPDPAPASPPSYASANRRSGPTKAAKASLDRPSRSPRDRRPGGLGPWVALLPQLGPAPSAARAPAKAREPTFETRAMRMSDVQTVRALHDATLPATYTTSYFFSLLSDPSHLCLVATAPASHPSYSYDPSRSASPSRSPTSPRSTSSLFGRPGQTIVGCASAKLVLPPSDNGDSLRDPLARPPTPPKTPSIRILTLCVHPTCRRKGVASGLLGTLLSDMSSLARSRGAVPGGMEVSLHVQAPNVVAKSFYERNGFRTVKLRSGYYVGTRMRPLDGSMRGAGVVDKGARELDAWYLEKEVS